MKHWQAKQDKNIQVEINSLIEQVLGTYKDYLQNDYTKYYNHACRVYVLCTKLDSNAENHDQYAIAAAFHDLGIWTNKTFDYLKPSIVLAEEWLARNNKSAWSKEIVLMIGMHHKMSPYTGECSATVEAFRKADWIDLSVGLLRYGLPAGAYRQIRKQFPTKGFHRFLVRKTLQNFLKHPLRPLPMFKK